MKNLVIWLTIAPRKVPTINACIKSLRDAGIDNRIYIFAEPWQYHIKDKNVKIIKNKKQLWCFRNYHNMVSQLVKFDGDYIATIQDDFIFDKSLWQKIEDILNYPFHFWYVNLHTRPRLEKFMYKNWWNNIKLWWKAWGMCYMYKKEVLSKIIEHPFYQSHLHTYKANQQIDACISEVLLQMGMPMYYYNPSLSIHIWDSVIWHKDYIPWERLSVEFDKRTVWVASIPNREDALKIMIDSLYHQVDRINVYLNWYDHIPKFLKSNKIKVFMGKDMWDVGKFYNIEPWYYFTCDDDLAYAANYIDVMIMNIERFNRKAIIWTHWVTPYKKVNSYYRDRYVFSFKFPLPSDVFVNILGTWVMWFHTNTIKINLKDFKQPNMADIYFWIIAQKQKIPMVCVKKEQPRVQQLTTNDSIYSKRVKNDDKETNLINSIQRKTYYT